MPKNEKCNQCASTRLVVWGKWVTVHEKGCPNEGNKKKYRAY